MERIWIKQYPGGVPASIDWRQFETIGKLFEHSVESFADRPAYESLGHRISFAELERLSRAFGRWLQDQGLVEGSRVAIMLPNCLQYPICVFGALRAGYVVVNVNPLYTPRELAHQLSDSGAESIVVLENFAGVVAEALESLARAHSVRRIVVTRFGDLMGARGWLINLALKLLRKSVTPSRLPHTSFHTAIVEGRGLPLRGTKTSQDDLAFLQYTGGTTGTAKGAMLLHRNILANLEQAAAWVRPFLDVSEQQVIITALPLYHVLSLTANCLLMMKLGGCNILITDPRNIRSFIRTLRNKRFTLITGVNTLYNALLNHPNIRKVDFSALRVSLAGGMPLQRQVADRWQAVTGCTLIEAYGLSETSPAVTINPLDLGSFSGSIGLPLPSTEIEIRDETGNEVPISTPGELWVRGPQVMKGYWQLPDETAKVIDLKGFFATGDIAVVDERGFIRLVDRKKDMIVVSGLKVYPNEVESVVAALPGVTECVAIGVPDSHSGEAVKLLIVGKGPELTEEKVRAHCRESLAGYKRPKYIEFRDELPKSNVGKILRRVLRDELSLDPQALR